MINDSNIIQTSREPRFTTLQVFASLTVGFSTLGAIVAVWQVFSGQVGLMEIALLAIFYFLTALGVEAGFHRYFSHAAFKGLPVTTWLLGALGSMAAQGPLLFWVATHRKHHAFTDKPGDPHSPYYDAQGKKIESKLHGIWHAHLGWLFGRQQVSWAKFAPDLLRQRRLITINNQYILWVDIGLLLPALIAGLIGGSWVDAWKGLVWGGLLRIFLADHVTWAVNSLCHSFGKKPNTVKNKSGNLRWLSIFSAGGSLHNNHHAFPWAARTDHQSKWQLDVSGLVIEMLGFFGLAHDIQRYSSSKQTQIERGETR